MMPNFSVPLSGLQQSGWDLDKIAQRITSHGQTGRSEEETGAAALGLDPAADTTRVSQVENTAETDFRGISTQDDLAKNMLDFFV